MTLQEFLANPRRNAWVTFERTEVYVRTGRRGVAGTLKPALTVANINGPHELQRTGQFKRLLQLIAQTLYDQYGPDHVLFLENVLNEHLDLWLESQGWNEQSDPMNFSNCSSYWLHCGQVLEILCPNT